MSLAFALSLFHCVLRVIANDNSSCFAGAKEGKSLLSLKQEVKTVDSKEMVEMDPYDCDPKDYKNFWSGKELCVYYKDRSTAKAHTEDGRLLDANIGLSQHGSFVVCKNLEAKEEEIGTCKEKWIDNRCARTHRWKPGDGDDKKGALPYDWCCKAEKADGMQFKKKKGKTIMDKVIILDTAVDPVGEGEGKCIGCSVKYGGLYVPLKYHEVEHMVITEAEPVTESQLEEFAEDWEAHAVIRCADRLTDRLTDSENYNSEKYEYMYYRVPRPFNPSDITIAKMVGKCEKWGVKDKTCD